ncbi:MAG: RloB domain-containing protein [Parapedobacter sp.]|nr:MAG: RloB domain-containing protein [Parapedobacter sp.]
MTRTDRPKRGTGRKTISIIVDGDTEVWYFQMLRETENLGQLAVKPELPARKTLAYQFSMVCSNAQKYDQVIWLVDADTIIKEIRESSKASKIQEVKGYLGEAGKMDNVHILFNTPCLEFWFLLHDRYTGRFYAECGAVEAQLTRSTILPEYAKTEKYFKNPKRNIYQRLKPNLKTAVSNAMRLGGFDIDEYESAKAETFKVFKILGIDV